MSDQKLTSVADLLAGYKEESVTLTSGKTFRIQSFTPGNLLIDIGSPLVDILTNASEQDLRNRVPLDLPNSNASRVWAQFERIVMDNVISVRFSPEPQSELPQGLVSLQRLSLVDIQELYVAIRDLSISPEELETFRAVHKTDEDEPEQPELDQEDSEDSESE